MDPEIGLITYHNAYNFGSVLQAYATQQTLNKLGHTNEIINYQTKSQTEIYQQDIRFKDGIKTFLYSLKFLPYWNQRKIRRDKFRKFISTYLNVSQIIVTTYEEVKNKVPKYPILMSGSDQIWNSACGEFRHESSDAILPYFLNFGNPQKRIALSSSIGERDLNYIKNFSKYLKEFDFLSSREPLGCKYISEVSQKDVTLVSDPTWFLTKDEWDILKINKNTKKPFIFIYTIGFWNKPFKSIIEPVIELARRNNWDIINVSPVFCIDIKGIKCPQDVGPLDFLYYIKNAELVISNTFHGTIFPALFERPFISYNAYLGSRQQQILNLIGLDNQIVMTPGDLFRTLKTNLYIPKTSERIGELRERSFEYLKLCLS
ncbi:MAG: polysaccharide pyruvyl transferase family protein [Ruminococcus sp.]|nr:polysaccharide pyruvyl transferase family protein [Ruminococcus sp.]MCC8145607.1 polysaccharide pyruvyl transferase family protein [Bacteroidales bacterium]MCC8174607.1 polysaccharide pyruvyl transferase family protein [Odoribacter sp.]